MTKQIIRLVCWLIIIWAIPGIEPLGAQSEPEQIDMAILVDRSSSMTQPGGDPQGLARAAVEFLLDQLELAHDGHRAALVLFNSTVTSIPQGGLTADKEVLRGQLQRLAEIRGNTDLEEALQEGLRLLSKSQGRKQLVLISDGLPEPDFTSARAQVRFQEQAKGWASARTDTQKRNILQQMSQVSTENILKSGLAILKENKIEIYPIALTGIEAHGEELLKQMALQVTQDAQAFKKIRGEQLVAGLDEIIPKPISLMNIRRAELTSPGQNNWTVDFPMDSSLERVRILVLYQKPPSDQEKWVLTGPMGTMSPDQPGAARYLAAKDKNGAGKTIFDRLFIDRPQAGNYTLTFRSKGFLPPMQVIVEGRTKLRLAATADPNPGEVGLPVAIFCRLEGDPAARLVNAQVRIVDDKGQSEGENLVFTPDANQVLKTSWTPGQPGSYRLLVRGFLDADKKRYLSTRLALRVQPKQAVELGIEIPTPPAKGSSGDPEGKVLRFIPLNPNQRGYTIEKIKATSTSNRQVPVTLSLSALRHEESNFALDIDKWCRLTPNQGNVSQNQPLEFDLRIQFPPKMPAGIPDGLFTGKLKIDSPEATQPLEVPIYFSLKLPNFTPIPPNLAESGLIIPMRCCIPGTAGTSFRVSTDVSTDQPVRVIAPLLLTNEETQVSLPPNEAWISLGQEETKEAEMTISAGGRGTIIPIKAHINNSSLKAGRYLGQLAVRAEMGRTLFIPITVVVPPAFWVRWLWWLSLVFTVFVAVWWTGRPLSRFRTYRNRFQGSDITVVRDEPNIYVPHPWDNLLAPVFRADITGTSNWHLGSSRCQASVQPRDPLSPPGSLIFREGATVNLTCGADSYELFVVSATPFQLVLRITGSPFRKSRLFGQLAFSLVLLGIGTFSLLYPEFWCRFLQ